MADNPYQEIERKFLVTALPPGYKDFPHKCIAQSYINKPGCFPVVRVRRYGDEYLMTFKKKTIPDSLNCHEVEFPIEPDIFDQLILMAEDRHIEKVRYFIPWDDKTIELDIFSGRLAGLVLAEIEYNNLEEAASSTLPVWFGKEVTQDRRYSNNHLSEFGLPPDTILHSF